MGYIKPPYFISTQLVAELMDVDARTAGERLTAIRKALKKPPGALISLAEYCDYEHTSLKELELHFMRTRGAYIPPEDKKANGI
jgi:hypothetical protein